MDNCADVFWFLEGITLLMLFASVPLAMLLCWQIQKVPKRKKCKIRGKR